MGADTVPHCVSVDRFEVLDAIVTVHFQMSLCVSVDFSLFFFCLHTLADHPMESPRCRWRLPFAAWG